MPRSANGVLSTSEAMPFLPSLTRICNTRSQVSALRAVGIPRVAASPAKATEVIAVTLARNAAAWLSVLWEGGKEALCVAALVNSGLQCGGFFPFAFAVTIRLALTRN